MAITRDGSPVNVASANSGASIAGTITTSLANNIIVVAVNALGTVIPVISGASGGGLTWAGRSTSNTASHDIGNGAARQLIEVWWAKAAAALTSQTITVSFSTDFNAASIDITAWNGCDQTTPWDVNGSLPALAASATFNVASVPTVTGVSTTNANTVLIALMGNQDATPPTAGSGYTLDYGNTNGNTFTNETIGVEHKIVSSAQSSVSVPFAGSVQDWLMVVDALQAASAAAAAVPYNPWPQMGPILAQRRKSIGWSPLFDHRRRPRHRERGLFVPDRSIIRREFKLKKAA